MEAKLTAAQMNLDALRSALQAAIEALLTWDIDSFREAAGQQRTICERLSSRECLPLSAEIVRKARRVRELNFIYARLLQHSLRWTRTMQAVLHSGPDCGQASRSLNIKG